MKEKNHYYCVGGHHFRISVASGADINLLLPSYRVFEEREHSGDLLFSLVLTDDIQDVTLQGEFARFDMDGFRWSIGEADREYAIEVIPDEDNRRRKMVAEKDFSCARAGLCGTTATDSYVLNNFVMMLYAFTSAPHDTLLFHASVVELRGKGYLFLGKSGTGKSTHSGLWLSHVEGSRLLNDDNPVVRLFPGGRAVVYGSPWSGKTPCYRNEEAPVGAIVRLKQAPGNKITLQPVVRAFASMLPSCSCIKQIPALRESVYGTILRLASLIRVYELKCLPDAEAAVLCAAETVH
jgi:hypothetical protein